MICIAMNLKRENSIHPTSNVFNSIAELRNNNYDKSDMHYDAHETRK